MAKAAPWISSAGGNGWVDEGIAAASEVGLTSMDFFRVLFGQNSFMPHGHCYLWDPGLMRLHLISDFLIAAAYFVIPIYPC